jgi:hypothetical protein
MTFEARRVQESSRKVPRGEEEAESQKGTEKKVAQHGGKHRHEHVERALFPLVGTSTPLLHPLELMTVGSTT